MTRTVCGEPRQTQYRFKTKKNMDEPKSPIDAYKAIIDQLVNDVRLSMHAGLVVERARFSNAPAHDDHNAFVRRLSPEDRIVLSEMLQEERDGTIHDVLAALTWWIICQNVGLTFRGEPMPVELSGMGLHGDYVGRRQGWEWPEEGEQTSEG